MIVIVVAIIAIVVLMIAFGPSRRHSASARQGGDGGTPVGYSDQTCEASTNDGGGSDGSGGGGD